eukprot:g2162.t1
MIDPDTQANVWKYLFGASKLNVAPRNLGLLVTEPVLCPRSLKEQMNELVFEKFEFASAAVATAPQLASFDIAQMSTTPSSGASTGCMLVVDSGFSFTHAVPMFQFRPIRNAVRRVSVGGKLLTNYLKELVSYRSYNMMEETYLINQVKEQLCFCSLDVRKDLRRKTEANRKLRREFVLPDYKESMEGYVRPLSTGDEAVVAARADGGAKEQVLQLQNERVGVPEALFHPIDVGLDEGGVASAVVQAIERCPARMRPCLYSNICLIGGNVRIRGFQERLFRELRALAPIEMDVVIETAKDPTISAWRGGSRWARDPSSSFHRAIPSYSSLAVTRSEYHESGHGAFLRKWPLVSAGASLEEE